MNPKPDRLPILAAALLGIALYALTLHGTYIYDDVLIANLDPRLHDVGRWSEFLTRPYAVGAPDRLFRPLTSLSFAIEWYLHGDRPWVMHLINTLLYSGVCAQVALLARRVAGTRAAWIAGLLFAAHPVHVEAVAYLVGRADLLATLGLLGGLLLFLRPRPMTTPRALAIWACMIFAILAKEPGMLLPPLLLAWLPWRRAQTAPAAARHSERSEESQPPAQPVAPVPYATTQTPAPDQSDKRATQLLVLLLCWTLAGYIVFREQSKVFKFSWDPFFVDRTMNPLIDAGPIDRLLVPFSLVGHYLQLLVAPWRLSIDYGGWVARTPPLSDPYFYLGLATVVAWWVGVIITWRRRAYAAFACLICFVVTYAMVSNFGILIGAIFGERLIFLPSAFFIVLLSLAAARIRRTPLLATAATILLILATLRTETYAWRWLDSRRLYTTCAAEQPDSVRLWMLTLDQLERDGDLEGAARAGAAGRAAAPTYWRIWYFSAKVDAERGRLPDALALIRHAEKIPNTDPRSLAQLRTDILDGKYGPPPPRPPPQPPPPLAPAPTPQNSPHATRARIPRTPSASPTSPGQPPLPHPCA